MMARFWKEFWFGFALTVLAILALFARSAGAQQIDWERQLKNKPVRDVRNYGNSLTGTGKQSYSGTLTAGSATFTLNSTSWDTFSPTDVGKNILISGGCASNVCDTWSSIASFISPTQVTLSSPAANTLSFVAEAYWWNPAQDDTTFIQAAINDTTPTAPIVYMPHGVYVIDNTNAPLAYQPTMKALIGDGRQSTVIIPQNPLFQSRTIVFNDVNHFLLKGMTFRGPGINAIFGGNITFHLVNQSNTEDLRIEDVEVRHACSDAIFVDTCILCSFRNVKTILNAAPGIHLHDPVAVTLQQAYSITNVGPGIWIDSGADVDISGSASESNGISYWIQNAHDVSVRDSDAEAQVHRAPSAPSSFPSASVAAGGTLPVGTYFLKYTWQRQFNSSALSLESTASPESSLVTLTSGNQTINFTLPIAPTDAPLVTVANVYITPTNGASGSEGFEKAITVSSSSTTAVSLGTFTQPGSAPPTVSLIGHAFVVDGSSHVHIDTDNSNGVPTSDARHLLIANGADDVQVDNFRVIEGSTTPASDLQINSGVTNTRLAGSFSGISLTDSGSNTVLVDRGTMGLGTSSPDVNLVVQSTTSAGAPQIGIKNAASGGSEWYLGSTDTGNAGGGGLFIINSVNSAVSPAFSINASKNVGVGTNNPLGLFNVATSTSAGANQMVISNSAAGGVNWWFGSTDNGNGINGGKFVIHNSSSPTGAQFTINSSNNNVGINQTSPAFALDVTGAVNATTGFLVSSAAAAGNVLRGNGSLFVSAQLGFGDLSGTVSSAQDPHALLSAFHTDTTAASPVRGDGLFAIGATPTWQRLAHPSTTGGYFKWSGTDMTASTGAAGGTGSCATHNFQTGDNADAAPTCAQPAFTDISGTATGAQLPNPSSSTLGGVESIAAATHNFLTSISTSGVPAQAQPTLADVNGGTAPAGQTYNFNSNQITSANLTGANSANSVTLLNSQGVTSPPNTTGNSADQVLYTYTLPANTLLAGQMLDIKWRIRHDTGTAAWVVKLNFGSGFLSWTHTVPDTVSAWYEEVVQGLSTTTQNFVGYPAFSDAGAFQGNSGSPSNQTATSSITITVTVNIPNTDTFDGIFFIVQKIQ
ncbi:MAG TPA: hypothetical protein VKY85_07595 [Candidatus Angelobacter sp.]|nr:hypothetical protein [Candidatus Angelobacter sp.]